MDGSHAGLKQALEYGLFDAIFQRRSRRVSTSVGNFSAGNLSREAKEDPHPLSDLEEALLIIATGVTGVPLPDFATRTLDGTGLAGHAMFNPLGRATSSVDNAQAAHFFLINDSGTYFLQQPGDVDPFVWTDGEQDPAKMVAYAEKCKIKLLDHRLEFPRRAPFYLGENRYVSNLPGTTILLPVVDVTRQFINGLLFLLSQPDGERPAFRDDGNFYRWAGVKKWVRNGYLNKDITIPVSALGVFRTDVEAYLIIQNLLLTIQAMGLGGWTHAAFPPPAVLGSDLFAADGRGLGFRFAQPKKWFRQMFRFLFPLTSWAPNPVGLDGILEGFCPPYYEDMSAAVDAVMALKLKKPGGVYTTTENLDKVLQPDVAATFLADLPEDSENLIQVVKDFCNYIYDTYGRFPAHTDAIFVPGIWVQAHHLDLDYYDQHYQSGRGYTDTQARHQENWHGP